MCFAKGFGFQTWIRNYLYKGNPARFFMLFKFYGTAIFWNVQKHKNLHFGLSETFWSVKNFILVFLKRSEAWKTSFWCFWNVQKHEKLHFGLSETFRSMKNLHLVFLKRSEAWKISFLSFCSVQKREKLLFGLSAVCRSMKNLYLVFLKCSEACFFPIFVFPRHA